MSAIDGLGKSRRAKPNYRTGGACFYSPSKKRDFVINPEWCSETPRVKRVQDLTRVTDGLVTYPPRRGRGRATSPTLRPSSGRDPVTWRHWENDWLRGTPGTAAQKPPSLCSKPSAFSTLGSKDSDKHRQKYRFDGTCFDSTNRTKRVDFSIHPDWVSESLSIHGLSIKEKPIDKPRQQENQSQRRCRSAPPPSKRRNPITWEYD